MPYAGEGLRKLRFLMTDNKLENALKTTIIPTALLTAHRIIAWLLAARSFSASARLGESRIHGTVRFRCVGVCAESFLPR